MRPVTTITLNPALDLATQVDAVTPGPKLRCAEPRKDPGGGGINVSRVVAEMGGQSTAMVALGGATGEVLEGMLRNDPGNVSVFAIPGDTRHSFSVVERETGGQYRFVMPGPVWDRDMAQAALGQIRDVSPAGSVIVFSGSLPPGVPADFPMHLCEVLANCDVVLDMSGSALTTFADSGTDAFMLRMDMGEGAMLNGAPLDTAEDTAEFAQSLVRRKAAKYVIIARGGEGSVLANADGVWAVRAADVEVNSKTGAGDSFVGAMVFALASGQDLLGAFSLGAAAASATVTTTATELCHHETVYSLLSECTVTRL
ncbi:MAG: hexose kinase [Paracoccaceae bacterium]|nr:hexose kinase [Paracoccaceae bacterium]MDP7184784.1 hexose kinase [Paracoccaceae bacterium]